jgi:hypothetical protein
MILPHIAQLNTRRIVLASGSPRRKELLKVLGLNKFEVSCVVVCVVLWRVLWRRAPPPPCIAHTPAASLARAREQRPQPPTDIGGPTACRELPPHTHSIATFMHARCHQIIVSSFEEDLPKHHFDNAADYAIETARHKALDVARLLAAAASAAADGGAVRASSNGSGSSSSKQQPVDLIISADTVRALARWPLRTCVLRQTRLASRAVASRASGGRPLLLDHSRFTVAALRAGCRAQRIHPGEA